jgi:hypothetical protein
MKRSNQALLQACSRDANMRVFDWADVAKDSWFIPDGIDYYSPGYAARAQRIADALAEAFPAHAQSFSRCVVEAKPLSVPVLRRTALRGRPEVRVLRPVRGDLQ